MPDRFVHRSAGAESERPPFHRLLVLLALLLYLIGGLPAVPLGAAPLPPPNSPVPVEIVTYKGQEYVATTLPYDLTLYRVWDSKNPEYRKSEWFTLAAPRSSEESQEYSAIPVSRPDRVDTYTLKAGTRFLVGVTAPLSGFLGGGTEVVVERGSVGLVTQTGEIAPVLPSDPTWANRARLAYDDVLAQRQQHEPDNIAIQNERLWISWARSIIAQRLNMSPAIVQETAEKFGSVPGGVLLEGTATFVGLNVGSVRYDGGGRFVINEAITYDTGISDEEVGLLDEFVSSADDPTRFGAVSQEQMVGVPADSIVARIVTQADLDLGSYVYGYDDAPELFTPPSEFTGYINPATQLLDEVAAFDIAAIQRNMENVMYSIEPRFFLRTGEVEFATVDGHIEPSSTQAELTAAAITVGSDPSVPEVADDPTQLVPEVVGAASWVNDHLPAIVAASAPLRRTMVYSQVLALLRFAHNNNLPVQDNGILEAAVATRSHPAAPAPSYTNPGSGYRSAAAQAMIRLELKLQERGTDSLTPYGFALVQLQLAGLAQQADQPQALAHYRTTAASAINAAIVDAESRGDTSLPFGDTSVAAVGTFVIQSLSDRVTAAELLSAAGDVARARPLLDAATAQCRSITLLVTADDPHTAMCDRAEKMLAGLRLPEPSSTPVVATGLRPVSSSVSAGAATTEATTPQPLETALLGLAWLVSLAIALAFIIRARRHNGLAR